MSLYVRLQSREGTPVNTGLILTPDFYSASVYGGPQAAEISVSGPPGEVLDILRWLDYRLWIVNGAGEVVWHGLITEAAANYGGVEIGVGMGTMANRIAVAYTVPGGGGTSTRATTAWVEHARSKQVYGPSELLYGAGEITASQAQALAARLLTERAWPRATVRPAASTAPGTGKLRCAGLWSTLGRRYFRQDAGRVVYSAKASGEQRLGWSYTSTQTGFRAASKRIHNLLGGLDALQKGEKIRVSGSASNNGTYMVDKPTRVQPTTYQSTGITFDPVDDIMDASNGLDFASGEMLYVSGSTSNNGTYTVDDTGTDHITVHPPTITAENATGNTVSFVQGHSITVAQSLADENPGANVTISANGQRVAQTFSHGAPLPWAVGEVWLQVRKEGTPGDGLIVEICADSAGVPGSVLASATLGASAIPAEMDWIGFSFSGAVSLTPGTTYWLVVRRTGTPSNTAFYWIGTDTEGTYGGSSKLHTGAGWDNLNAWLPFEIWGQEDLGTQLHTMLGECEHLSGAELRVTVGVSARQWRAGDQTIQDEVEAILDSGTSAGRRLIATVTPEGRAIVDVIPAESSPALLLNQEGVIVDKWAGALPEGGLPVGLWCGLQGIPAHINDIAVLSPFFIEQAEYDAASNVVRFAVAADEGPWQLAGVGQG